MRANSLVVFLVNADDSWSQALKDKLATGGFQVRVFASADRFLESFKPDHCHCAIIDLDLPDIDGLTLQRMIHDRQWQIPIIFVTRTPLVSRAVAAMRAGALTVLDWPKESGELLGHVREALAMHTAYREKRARQRQMTGCLEQLTPRQRQVLDLIVQGKTTRDIAQHLFISIKTVETHREHIMRKLAAHNVADVVRIASAANTPIVLDRNQQDAGDTPAAVDGKPASKFSKRQDIPSVSPLKPADPQA